tara:strand:- start:703 stop:1350 length:648 start_codon:yes stop_codon:yes gene_type:complete
MIKKLKQTLSEKILLIFIISLAFIFFGSIITIKNKCMFIKNYDPKKIIFDNPKNIAIMNLYCGNVIIELYPKISPNSVKRFKMLVRSGKYNNVAFHRVIKDVLVQSGDLEFGKKDNLNYTYIGTGRSGYGNIKSELDGKFDFKVGTVALARTDKKNSEDSQFFILLQDAPLFEGEYTPIGKVIYGLEILRKIKYSDKTEYVLRPDFINNFEMLIN